eukprot:TRINITY_DN3655_c0_g1_i2.p1 TRINITY_DN3655_c0_g1~~TRINITY_DN3655_c0_g1_i2.p1  ORF type:complete len:938 (+),score=189.72 TRINITY_DN3655_c0_g1_i2:659-3472(+)
MDSADVPFSRSFRFASTNTSQNRCACLSVCPSTVQLLLDAGADVSARQQRGLAALHMMYRARGEFSTQTMLEVQSLLLDAGCDPDISDSAGRTPLFYAYEMPQPHPELVRQLLENSADPNVFAACRSGMGNQDQADLGTLLFQLITEQNPIDYDFVDLLLQYGANPYKGMREKSALDAAVSMRDAKLINMFQGLTPEKCLARRLEALRRITDELGKEMKPLVKVALSPSSASAIHRMSRVEDMLRWTPLASLQDAVHSFKSKFAQAGLAATEKGPLMRNFITALSERNLLPAQARSKLYRYVFHCLYDVLLEAQQPELQASCERLARHMEWARTAITPEFLDLRMEGRDARLLQLAEQALAELDWCVLPEEKLKCILACAQVLSKFCGGMKAGADDVTPAIVLTAARTNVNTLQSHLAYIRDFGNTSSYDEQMYYYVSLCGAVDMIEHTTPQQINQRAIALSRPSSPPPTPTFREGSPLTSNRRSLFRLGQRPKGPLMALLVGSSENVLSREALAIRHDAIAQQIETYTRGGAAATAGVLLPRAIPAVWDAITEILQAPIPTPTALDFVLAALDVQTPATSPNKPLQVGHFFEHFVPPPVCFERFFDTVLPSMQRLAVQLNEFLPEGVPFLLPAHAESVSLSHEQAASLLACTFFNTVLPPATYLTEQFGNFSFRQVQQPTTNPLFLLCLINYFRCLARSVPAGKVTFARHLLPNGTDAGPAAWADCAVPLCAVTFTPSKGRALQVAFSGSFVGGSVLSGGCGQEELLFATRPESVLAMLLCPRLGDRETVIIDGAVQYSDDNGGGFSTEVRGTDTVLCVMDAAVAVGQPDSFQLEPASLLRDLNKAYCGFLAGGGLPVRTGDWCCDTCGCDRQVKFLQQWLAASRAGCPSLAYCGSVGGAPELVARLRAPGTTATTVGQLWRRLAAAQKLPLFASL